MREVAAQMLTGIIEADTVDFTHTLCEGRVVNKGRTVYGAIGGTLFFGDFGQLGDRPNTVYFFVPRGSEHFRFTSDSLITSQAFETETGQAVDYPEDVDVGTVRAGTLLVVGQR